MLRMVTISGSPSPSSRTTALVEHLKRLPAVRKWRVESIEVRDLPPEDLIYARFDSPSVQRTVRLLELAEGVIIATPVYKASYTGVLKAYLDLLPKDILSEKVVLPLAVGGTRAHQLVLDYALKPVFYALGAEHVLSGIFIEDRWIQEHQDNIHLEGNVQERIEESLERFRISLTITEE